MWTSLRSRKGLCGDQMQMSVFLSVCSLSSVSDSTVYRIFNNFCTVIPHKSLSSKCRFRWNRSSVSHTLLKGVNVYVSIVPKFRPITVKFIIGDLKVNSLNSCESRENWYTETIIQIRAWIKFWPHFYKFCPIWIKFGVGDVQKNLLTQNRSSGSHT